MNCAVDDLVDVLDSIELLDGMDEKSFHDWEFEVVQRYRRNEAEQEAIAVLVTRHNLRPVTARVRARLDELLVMLSFTHDPLL